MEFHTGNKGTATKLFLPTQDQATGHKNTPVVMIAGPKTALCVIKELPLPEQLEQWAENNLEGKERQMVEKRG